VVTMADHRIELEIGELKSIEAPHPLRL
jgi:hypothetical protein